MNEAKMTELSQAEEMAYFRADLCLYSPESYSLEEKKQIYNEMMSTSKAVLDAMREDFDQMPPDARAKLLDMLCQSGVESPEWWWNVLVGEGDPLYRELEPGRSPPLHRHEERPARAPPRLPLRQAGDPAELPAAFSAV